MPHKIGPTGNQPLKITLCVLGAFARIPAHSATPQTNLPGILHHPWGAAAWYIVNHGMNSAARIFLHFQRIAIHYIPLCITLGY